MNKLNSLLLIVNVALSGDSISDKPKILDKAEVWEHVQGLFDEHRKMKKRGTDADHNPVLPTKWDKVQMWEHVQNLLEARKEGASSGFKPPKLEVAESPKK